jgi:hypothetical protein
VLKILEAYLPSDFEMKQVEKLLDEVEQDFPDLIAGYDYEMTTDWTGDPAVQILLFIKDEAAARSDLAERTLQVGRRIREALTAEGSTRWPFVHFRTRSELQASWAAPL